MMFPDGYAVEPGPAWNASLMPIETLAPLLGLTLPVAPPLDAQIAFASEAVTRMIRNYVGRMLTRDTYTEDFGHPAVPMRSSEGREPGVRFNLTEWPVATVDSVTMNGTPRDVPAGALHHGTGALWLPWPGQPSLIHSPARIVYTGGYTPLPGDLAGVFLDLVRRQLVAMGSDLPPGATAPVKAVTVGALKVEYAVTAQAAAPGAPGGLSPLTADAITAYSGTLDHYRSVRTLAATGT